MLESTKSSRLYLGRSLSTAFQEVMKPSGSYGARNNIAKLIIALIGSPSMDTISEETIKLITSPYIATVAVGYGNASEVFLFYIFVRTPQKLTEIQISINSLRF